MIGVLFWPQKELIQKLRNRSAAINITTENIDDITANARVIYSIQDDPDAVPPAVDEAAVPPPAEETAEPPVTGDHGAPPM